MRDIKSLKVEIEKQLLKPLGEVSVVELVDLFVEYAYATRATDVHIDPEENSLRVRFRIDGILQDIFSKIKISKHIHPEVVSRIKVMAGLRTDEHQTPQDGRLRVTVDGFNIDVRVSILPTHYGENAVMRILAQTQEFQMEDLAFSDVDLERIKEAMKRPYGMILANGPTGSGKSTTLYTILRKLNRPEVAVITVEDPIEYTLPGAKQIQVNNQAGLTFAVGLRSILRQDPNIIMVGEIRDAETANIAVNAALTGHLLLSTLHTNDAATTFPRLMDMGVPPFLAASTVNLIVGQRLLRVLCSQCKIKHVLSTQELAALTQVLPNISQKDKEFYSPGGCAVCNQSGYQSRTGVREVLVITESIRRLILEKASAAQIKVAAVKEGMNTMLEDGLIKARQGITSIEEVLRIVHE